MNGCEGFEPQTLQQQKTKSQSNKEENEGLKGFRGKKNAYRAGLEGEQSLDAVGIVAGVATKDFLSTNHTDLHG